MNKVTFVAVFISFLIHSSYETLNAQSRLRELTPEIGRTPVFDQNAQRRINRRDELMEKEKLSSGEQKELDQLLLEFSETTESIWEILGGGCSWYCGGDPYRVTASSYLKTQGSTSYDAMKAHDDSFKTAWVEGAKGPGIGEYLEYWFENKSPRITEIIILNGYIKSDKVWEENARVKKLEMSVNGNPYAVIHLQDTKAEQHFKIPPLGHRVDKKDLVLTFKILEVYPGTVYEDAAITELYFDGIDVHCLARNSKILLSNNKVKNIEDLVVGDTVCTFDFSKNAISHAIIRKQERVYHRNLAELIFQNGEKITATQDHPFYINGKGWCSLKPAKSARYKNFGAINRIEPGDLFEFLDINGQVARTRLVKINYLEKGEETYTISKLDGGNNFIANGFIVGVEELTEDYITSFSLP